MINEDFATTYDATNGRTAHNSTGDTTFNLFDPTVVPQISSSCATPTDPTCHGIIHAEIDHDWKAAGYCGTGTVCDNATLASQTNNSTLIDVQGYIFWDPDNLNFTWHQFNGWEIHPLTAWRLSSTVNFSWSPTTPQVGQPVAFTATSNGTTPSSFGWDFGDGVTASGKSTFHIYITAQAFSVHVTMTDTQGVTVSTTKIVNVGGSWNSAVSCEPAQTTLEGVIGNISIQRIPTNPNSTGADYSGGGYRLDGDLPFGSNPTTWPFNKRDLHPPCMVSGTPAFVEIHNVTFTDINVSNCGTTYSIVNGGGPYPNGWQSCDTTFNLITPGFGDPSTCPKCYMHKIYGGIDRDWNASNVAPLPRPADGQRIDLQGFVYWNNVFVNASWHSYSGWEIHPLTAWRPAHPRITASVSFTPSNPTTAQTVSFNGTSSGGTGPYTFTWDFGDGTNATGNPASHAYALGTYAVHMAATDSFGTVGLATVTVKVTDAPPTVSFTESATVVPTGTLINLTITASDPDGTVGSLKVVWGDGTIDTLAGTATTDSHAYAVAGSYSVYVNATDNAGLTTKSAVATKTITDRPPTVSFTESATTATTGQTITLTITAADPDGTVASLEVSWGDGTVDTFTGTATTDSHAYASTGSSPTATFTVYVNATDNSGSTTKSVTATKTISDRAPTVGFTESATTAPTGTSISLTITAADPDGTVASLKVVWGDGTIDTLAGTATTDSHAYASTSNSLTATFTVYVNATDNSGVTTKSSSATKTISDSPPTVSFTESATTVPTGTSVTLTITAADPDGTVASLKVVWGDGTIDALAGTATTDSHAYAVAGTYSAYVNVTDNSGSSSKSSMATKTITDRPPVVSFAESATTAPTSTPINLTISSSDPDGTIASLRVVWGDGTVDNLTGTATSDSHSYSTAGSYSVYVNATDNANLTTKSAVAAKTIADRFPVVTFTESATTAPTGTPINLTISANDPDGTLTSIRVSWGDGTVDTLPGTATSDSHSYTSTGNATSAIFQVYVNATDNSGSTTKSTVAAKTITDRPPVVSYTESASTAPTGTSITLNVTATDPDGNVAVLRVVWGDGTVDTLAGTATADSHSYSSTGNAQSQTFQVYVNATDNSGSTTRSSLATKTITDRAPTVSFTESLSSAQTGQTITLNITASDPDGTVGSLKVSWGDGTVDTLPGIATSDSHSYASTGSDKSAIFQVYVNATDSAGLTGKSSVATKTIVDRLPVASFTESSISVLTGVSISFNATASSDPDGTIASYSWTFGDGTTGNGVAVTHSYANTGSAKTLNYTVTLTVTDNGGNTATAQSTETITDRSPTASFTSSAPSALTGVSITFNATASIDPDGSITSYAWTFGDGGTGAGSVVTHSYASTGSAKTENFTVTLTVTDNSGNTGTAQSFETITDRPPTASFTASTISALTGVSITFNATSSNDPDGTISTYSWSFGDGSTGSGVTVSHTYASTGSSLTQVFTVTLTATDNSGNTGTATSLVTITDRVPVASFTGSPATAYTGVTISFNATASGDPDGIVTAYSWSFGDGGTGSGQTISHSYPVAGNYTVILTVTDNSGNRANATLTETILDRPPVVVFSSSSLTSLTLNSIGFNATGSFDPDGTIVGYGWNFGDGSTASGIITAHAYAWAGNYTVVLAVTDNSGLVSFRSVVETALDRAPTASFVYSPASPLTGQTISYDASSSSDPDGTIVGYAWAFGDGTTGTGAAVQHSYLTNGTFTVLLTVTDNSGSRASTSTTVTVGNDPAPVFPQGSSLKASSVGPRGLTLTWTPANDSVQVTAYRVYENGTLLVSLAGSVTSYSVSGLSPYTHYLFQVQAGNPSGNYSTNGPSTLAYTRLQGDVNHDCKVDITDLVLVASSFGRTVGDPRYNPNADLNGDGIITVADLSLVGLNFGQVC